ncbi:formylglycine-generating enzyme family protein [Gammaproteobacteria bacterium]|nr:formylglycine-generating enzyme family protein [Gammaproteobacteria bacterium]
MRLKFDILELKKFLPYLISLMVIVSFKVGSDELKEVIVDCENCPQLIEVKPGSFIKGSPEEVEGSRDDERPQHEVNIAYTFYASKFEVKRIEYEQFINDTGYDMSGGCYGATEEGIVLGEDLSWFEPGYQVSDDHPVVCVSWNDAKAYVRWLSQKTGFKYRLFSESEWEYIARAGTSTIRFWGDSDEGCEYANGADLDITPEAFLEEMKGRQSKIVLPDDWKVANCHDGYMTSSPVGSFKPNAFGIYDILGNVAEWVEDCWGNSYESTPRDGSPRLDGDCNRPILRGASYYDMPIYLRSSNHYGFESSQSENKDTRYINFGFRVMREAK